MKRRTVLRAVTVLAVGAAVVTTFSSLWRRTHDPFRPLAPYVYRERTTVSHTLRVSVTHVKGVDVSQVKALLEPNLYTKGFSKESDVNHQYPYDVEAVYNRDAPQESIEVINGKRHHLDGVIVVYLRDAGYFESLANKWFAPRSYIIDSVDRDEGLRRFLGE